MNRATKLLHARGPLRTIAIGVVLMLSGGLVAAYSFRAMSPASDPEPPLAEGGVFAAIMVAVGALPGAIVAVAGVIKAVADARRAKAELANAQLEIERLRAGSEKKIILP